MWQLPPLKFIQGGLFAFPDGLLPVRLDMTFAFASSLPFPSPFEFRCGEHVGERGRHPPFGLSCFVHACMRAHPQTNIFIPTCAVSPLSE